MFENARFIALDINGTLIDGVYRSWEWVFEHGLNLKKKQEGSHLRWREVQTGHLSFEDAVSMIYDSVDYETVREEANRIYMTDLNLREGCIDLLETLSQRYILIVCSDTSSVTKVIVKYFGLEKYFSSFFYSIDIGWLKRDCDFWKVFLRSFPESRADEFVMIGDNTRCDIHWPNFFGISTIQVKTTENLSVESLTIRDQFDRPSVSANDLHDVEAFFSQH